MTDRQLSRAFTLGVMFCVPAFVAVIDAGYLFWTRGLFETAQAFAFMVGLNALALSIFIGASIAYRAFGSGDFCPTCGGKR